MNLMSLFSSPDKVLRIAEKGMDGAISGIDKLIFTDEEKSEAGKAIVDAHIKLMQVLSDENTARSITRRYISVAIIYITLFLALLGVGLYRLDPDYSQFIFSVVKDLSTPFLAVLTFYMGPYQIGQAFKGIKK